MNEVLEMIDDELYAKYFKNWFLNRNVLLIMNELDEKKYVFTDDINIFQNDEKIELECKSKQGKINKLKGYKNCIVQEPFIINNERKLYRFILLSDLKDFNGQKMLLYMKKYVCIYMNGSLFFPNKNQYIENAQLDKIDDLEPISEEKFISMYFKNDKEGKAFRKINIKPFEEINDYYIDSYLSYRYNNLMLKHLLHYDSESKHFFKEQYEKFHIDYFKLLPLYSPYISFCEKVLPKDYFFKQIKKKREIWKNIKNNIWINYQYDINNKNEQINYVEGEDYTFLIINLIKAFEFLLYQILIDSPITLSDRKDIDDRIMLDSMIQIIKKNKDILLRKEIRDFIDEKKYQEYINHLIYIKKYCRNGYFHKERMDNYGDLLRKRELVFEGIIETIALIGK